MLVGIVSSGEDLVPPRSWGRAGGGSPIKQGMHHSLHDQLLHAAATGVEGELGLEPTVFGGPGEEA